MSKNTPTGRGITPPAAKDRAKATRVRIRLKHSLPADAAIRAVLPDSLPKKETK